VGKALLGKHARQKVTVETPGGSYKLTVVKIK
jgi:transcription elongation GreA/GreB family factor